MTKEETRKEVLELLARGKITIDEAVMLLDQSAPGTAESKADDDGKSLKIDVDVDVDVEKETVLKPDLDLAIEDIPLPVESKPAREPRWLRIQVASLDSGKSKVNVNVPFGIVKWGLGVAQIFTPSEYSENLDQIGAMVAEAESGLLVDVQDEESNDHVRIYFE